MVVTSIAVAGTTDGTSYVGPYPETGVPSETTVEMGIVVQLGTEEGPRTKGGFVQSLLALSSPSNMYLPFSPS